MATIVEDFLGVFKEMVKTGGKVGVNKDVYAKLAHDKQFFSRVVDMALNENPLKYPINVNYLDVLETLNDAYAFDPVSWDDFFNYIQNQVDPASRFIEEIHLLRFRRNFRRENFDGKHPDNVIDAMKRLGYRPARIEEVVCLAERLLLKGEQILGEENYIIEAPGSLCGAKNNKVISFICCAKPKHERGRVRLEVTSNELKHAYKFYGHIFWAHVYAAVPLGHGRAMK